MVNNTPTPESYAGVFDVKSNDGLVLTYKDMGQEFSMPLSLDEAKRHANDILRMVHRLRERGRHERREVFKVGQKVKA